MLTVTWEDQCLNPERPSFLLLPSALIAECDVTCLEFPFGQLGSAVSAVSPSNFLPTPGLLAGAVV